MKYAEFDVNVDTDVINLVPPTSTVIRSDAPNERFCLLADGSSLLVDILFCYCRVCLSTISIFHLKLVHVTCENNNDNTTSLQPLTPSY